MTVYVIREGQIVAKRTLADARADKRSIFPTPMLSRMEPYESPIDGHEVTSWGERNRELEANNAFDPRDLSKDHVYKRGRKVQLNERPVEDQPDLFQWRDPIP